MRAVSCVILCVLGFALCAGVGAYRTGTTLVRGSAGQINRIVWDTTQRQLGGR